MVSLKVNVVFIYYHRCLFKVFLGVLLCLNVVFIYYQRCICLNVVHVCFSWGSQYASTLYSSTVIVLLQAVLVNALSLSLSQSMSK